MFFRDVSKGLADREMGIGWYRYMGWVSPKIGHTEYWQWWYSTGVIMFWSENIWIITTQENSVLERRRRSNCLCLYTCLYTHRSMSVLKRVSTYYSFIPVTMMSRSVQYSQHCCGTVSCTHPTTTYPMMTKHQLIQMDNWQLWNRETIEHVCIMSCW